MLCECGEREATIHEVVIKHGKKIEKHLCEQCAAKHGIDAKPQVPIDELLSKYIMSQGSGVVVEQSGTQTSTCTGCGLSFAEFKRSGLLGCPACYKTFEERLGPLLDRAHGGATHHTGKIPRRALASTRLGESGPDVESLLGGAEERAERLSALRRQLDEALQAEQYERAAKLRDEIRRLSEIDPAGEKEA